MRATWLDRHCRLVASYRPREAEASCISTYTAEEWRHSAVGHTRGISVEEDVLTSSVASHLVILQLFHSYLPCPRPAELPAWYPKGLGCVPDSRQHRYPNQSLRTATSQEEARSWFLGSTHISVSAGCGRLLHARLSNLLRVRAWLFSCRVVHSSSMTPSSERDKMVVSKSDIST